MGDSYDVENKITCPTDYAVYGNHLYNLPHIYSSNIQPLYSDKYKSAVLSKLLNWGEAVEEGGAHWR